MTTPTAGPEVSRRFHEGTLGRRFGRPLPPRCLGPDCRPGNLRVVHYGRGRHRCRRSSGRGPPDYRVRRTTTNRRDCLPSISRCFDGINIEEGVRRLSQQLVKSLSQVGDRSRTLPPYRTTDSDRVLQSFGSSVWLPVGLSRGPARLRKGGALVFTCLVPRAETQSRLRGTECSFAH